MRDKIPDPPSGSTPEEHFHGVLDPYLVGDLPDAEAQQMNAHVESRPEWRQFLWTINTWLSTQRLRVGPRQDEAFSRLRIVLQQRAGQLASGRESENRIGKQVLRRTGQNEGFLGHTLRNTLWFGAMGAVLGCILILAHRGGTSHPEVAHVYATLPHQQAIVNLDDGTRVTLAPQTTLRVPQFGTQTRTVVLDGGEAYFEVARASGAPFIVRSSMATTRVLGTAFLIRYDPANPHIRVAVTDGKVRVTTRGRAESGVTLTSGEVGDVTDSTTHVSTADDLAPGTEWTPGRIIFHHTPLATVLETVSRWYGYQFRYADQTLGQRSVTMVISTQSSAEALATIERVLAVNFTVVGDTVTLVPHPPRANRSGPRIQTYDIWSPTREAGR